MTTVFPTAVRMMPLPDLYMHFVKQGVALVANAERYRSVICICSIAAHC